MTIFGLFLVDAAEVLIGLVLVGCVYVIWSLIRLGDDE